MAALRLLFSYAKHYPEGIFKTSCRVIKEKMMLKIQGEKAQCQTCGPFLPGGDAVYKETSNITIPTGTRLVARNSAPGTAWSPFSRYPCCLWVWKISQIWQISKLEKNKKKLFSLDLGWLSQFSWFFVFPACLLFVAVIQTDSFCRVLGLCITIKMIGESPRRKGSHCCNYWVILFENFKGWYLIWRLSHCIWVVSLLDVQCMYKVWITETWNWEEPRPVLAFILVTELLIWVFSNQLSVWVWFSSVVLSLSLVWLCVLRDCSTLDFPVLHHLP